MENPSYPERVHLGFDAKKLFSIKKKFTLLSSSSSPKPISKHNYDQQPSFLELDNSSTSLTAADGTHQNTQLDFNDVFGGPPSRAFTGSGSGAPTSFSSTDLVGEDEEAHGSLNLNRGKPVFGEVEDKVLGRRTAHKLFVRFDFFDDVFGGVNPPSSSSGSIPKRGEKENFCSSLPASHQVSPVRSPGVPSRQPFSPAASLPSKASLSAEFGRRTNFSTSTTPSCLSPKRQVDYNTYSRSRNRNSNYGIRDTSPIIPVFSNTVGDYPHAHGHGRDIHNRLPTQSDQELPNAQASNTHNLFHQSRLSRQFSLKRDETSSPKAFTSLAEKRVDDSSDSQHNMQFHFSIHKWAGNGPELLAPVKGTFKHNNQESEDNRPKKMVLSGIKTAVNETMSTSLCNLMHFEKEQVHSPPSINFKVKSRGTQHEEKVAASGLTSRKSSLPPQKGANVNKTMFTNTLVSDDADALGEVKKSKDNHLNERVMQKKKAFEKPIVDQKEKVLESVDSLRPNESDGSRIDLQASELSREGNVRGNTVNGRVKDFVKKFSQVSSPKLAQKTGYQYEKAATRGVQDADINLLARVSSIDADQSGKSSDCVGNSEGINFPLKASENSTQVVADEYFDLPFSVEEVTNSMPDIRDMSGSCVPQESSQDISDEIDIPLCGNACGSFESLDIKIKEWAVGKEGNIRSLLSTLQYILWPESGWKPVPLVELIEVAAVKRAYQKALLCVHPDKLQQKSATAIHKDMAEKVYDVLQAAWSNFCLDSSS